MGNLPNRRGKKAKHDLSQTIKPKLPQSQSPVNIVDVDLSTPAETTPSKTPPPMTTVSASSQPSKHGPSNIIEKEDLACKHFQKFITDEDINTCYDMSLKDFEHSGVHDLFKVCSHIFPSSLSKKNIYIYIYVYMYIYIFHLTFIFFFF